MHKACMSMFRASQPSIKSMMNFFFFQVVEFFFSPGEYPLSFFLPLLPEPPPKSLMVLPLSIRTTYFQSGLPDYLGGSPAGLRANCHEFATLIRGLSNHYVYAPLFRFTYIFILGTQCSPQRSRWTQHRRQCKACRTWITKRKWPKNLKPDSHILRGLCFVKNVDYCDLLFFPQVPMVTERSSIIKDWGKMICMLFESWMVY